MYLFHELLFSAIHIAQLRYYIMLCMYSKQSEHTGIVYTIYYYNHYQMINKLL